MKKKLFLGILAAGLIAAVVLTSCELVLMSVGGNVVDARTEGLDGIQGATVELKNSSGTTVDNDITTSSGSYLLEYEDEGDYTITASKDGYVFIDLDITIGGWLQSLPDIMGLTYENDSDISLVTMWDKNYDDVDMHLTYPKDGGSGSATYGWFEPATYSEIFGDSWGSTAPGFGPNTTENREWIYHANQQDDTTVTDYMGEKTSDKPVIEMDRDDVDGFGPETITLRKAPFYYSNIDLPDYGMSAPLGLEGSGEWTMVGLGEVYLDAYSAGDSYDGDKLDDAHPTVYVIQGDAVLGSVEIPQMNTERVSVLRMGIYQEYDTSYQLVFYTNLRQMGPDESFRSASSEDSPYRVVAACPMEGR